MPNINFYLPEKDYKFLADISRDDPVSALVKNIIHEWIAKEKNEKQVKG